jgi:Family of unknown function (DUF5675)
VSTSVVRRLFQDADGLFGEWVLWDGSRVASLEPCWAENAPFLSAIPEGTYPLRRGIHHKDGSACLVIQDVPGRDDVLVHAANWASQLEACMAPGEAISWMQGRRAVTNSKETLGRILQLFPGDGARVTFACSAALPRMEVPR